VPDLDAQPLARKDGLYALGVGLVSAALFATTFSAHVSPGDAPESIAGVKALGILHAPGYPSYVLAARAFTEGLPFVSFTFRVLLFSLVCAAIAVAGVFLIARCFRSSRAGAAVGALGFASTTSFWFNSAFAKHYSFSAALVVVAILLTALWSSHGSRGSLFGAAIVLGLGFGAAWQLALITTIGLVVFLVTGARRPGRALAASVIVVMSSIAIGCYAFVLVRAGQHPALNWGEASTPKALARLISQRDFSHVLGATTVSNPFLRTGLRLVSYPAIVERDFGFGALVLAIAGIVIAWKRFRPEQKWLLVTLTAVNLAAVIARVPIDRIGGFYTSIFAGGFLVDLMIAVAVLVAVGFTFATRAATQYLEQRDEARAHWIIPSVASALAVVVLVPSVAFHYVPANHRVPAIVDDYAARALDVLPPRSVLVVFANDSAFPFEYRQIVDGQRSDVTVINLQGFGYGWYQDQVQRELGVAVPHSGPILDSPITTMNEIRRTRPVYIDTGAMQVLQSRVAYRVDGFVGEVIGGTPGPHPVTALAAASAKLTADDTTDHVTGGSDLRFPNTSLLYLRARAHVELAKAYVLAHDSPGATRELQQAVAIYPGDDHTNKVLLFMEQHGTGAEDVILHM